MRTALTIGTATLAPDEGYVHSDAVEMKVARQLKDAKAIAVYKCVIQRIPKVAPKVSTVTISTAVLTSAQPMRIVKVANSAIRLMGSAKPAVGMMKAKMVNLIMYARTPLSFH